MKNVVITGTNGMIGNLVLENCLERSDVSRVTSITRKKIGKSHPKLVEVFHEDFSDCRSLASHLKNQDACFYCIGVYTGSVSPEEFHKITIEHTQAFASVYRESNPQSTFCFLSGQGADSKERSRLMFARDKGIAENILLRMNFGRTHIFRPGYIFPVTPRKEPNTIYKLMRVLYKMFSGIFPEMGVRSDVLAKAMVDVGLNGGEKTIYENRDIRRFEILPGKKEIN